MCLLIDNEREHACKHSTRDMTVYKRALSRCHKVNLRWISHRSFTYVSSIYPLTGTSDFSHGMHWQFWGMILIPFSIFPLCWNLKAASWLLIIHLFITKKSLLIIYGLVFYHLLILMDCFMPSYLAI